VKGVGFPSLRVSGNQTREFIRLLARPMNLGLRASYRHYGRDPLPMKRRKMPPIKALTGEASETRSSTEHRH
jgi:hypothetical protein